MKRTNITINNDNRQKKSEETKRKYFDNSSKLNHSAFLSQYPFIYSSSK